jgi:hypothetical protein
VLTEIFGDVIIIGGGFLTVLAEVLELGTEVGLELATGLIRSGVDGLFAGDSDLIELVVVVVAEVLTLLFFLFTIFAEMLTEVLTEVLRGFLFDLELLSGFMSKRFSSFSNLLFCFACVRGLFPVRIP